MNYNYLFIDWYKTLSASVFWEPFKDDDHPYHRLYEPIQKVLFRESFDVLNNWMRGYLTSEDVVEQVCKEFHFEPEMMLKELILSCQNMRLMSENTLHLITEIRSRGVKVIIATDNMDTFQRWTVPSLSLDAYFDDILSSSELGALKSDTDEQGRSLFFTPYLKSNEIGAGESLLLDDSDERLGQIIRRTGIDYERVEPGTLDPVLSSTKLKMRKRKPQGIKRLILNSKHAMHVVQ